MTKNIKSFTAGVLVATLLWTTAFAAPVQKKITAVYNDIKIYVNGVLTQPKDTNGNAIEPFISEGVTYLPVKAVAEALDKNVSWDSKTKSIQISDRNSNSSITVSNADELVAAIGSGKHIILKSGIYNLSEITKKSTNSNVSWTKVEDGEQLTLTDIKGMSIEAAEGEKAEIVIDPRYAEIFSFKDCNNISLKNLKIGHTDKEEYMCNAGVLGFENTKNIDIENCVLYGCGSEGFYCRNVDGMKFNNSIIENCNLRVMGMDDCKKMNFIKSTFRNCKYASMFSTYNSEDVVFDSCTIDNNQSDDGYTFLSFISSNVKFINSKFINNKAMGFIDASTQYTTFEGTTFEGNTFDAEAKKYIADSALNK